ncbi:MAG: phosphoribosylformylglycinamidine cyclo-ligase, partial [Planctomycetota bacterium]
GCLSADCALLGGETAIMPDLYQKGDYDLAGFCVGVVEKKHVIEGKSITDGDVVIGVGSSGIHSNGFSLVRKIVFDVAGKKPEDHFPGTDQTIADVLIKPTLIYAKACREILSHYKVKNVVHGIAHITGGGLAENIDRITPPGLLIDLDASKWKIPPVFPWLQELGNVEVEEMYRVFNMGIGLAMIVSPYYADSIRRTLDKHGLSNWVIGGVRSSGTDSLEKKVTVHNR